MIDKLSQLQKNNLSGTVPHSICNLKATFTALDLSSNTKMRGMLPHCFSEIKFKVLRLTGTGLTGEIPAGLCGISEINGLEANSFGCDAIACPVGTFQKDYGRQINNETACVTCDATSNTIGNTECSIVNNTMMLKPSSSLNPSYHPTPSWNFTGLPTSFENSPSIFPSAYPLATGSMPSPWISHKVAIKVSLSFPSITSLMDEATILIFQKTTFDFISATMPYSTANVATMITLLSVELVSQGLESPLDLKGTGDNNTGLLEVFRTLQAETKISGVIHFSGASPKSSFEQLVLHGFRSNMSQLLDMLSSSSSFFAAAGKMRAKENGDRNIDEMKSDALILTVIMLTLCCVAIAVCFVALRNQNISALKKSLTNSVRVGTRSTHDDETSNEVSSILFKICEC